MGHTNSTANLSLPQFIGTDKPTWLGDVNGAFSAIDSKVGTIDADISAVDAKADNAVADASNAVTTATNANNTAGTASTTATNALNIANNALTVANNADGHTNQLETKIGLLADLTTTDKSSIVNAINEVDAKTITVSVSAEDVAYNNTVSGLTATDVQAAIDELASGSGAGSVEVTADGVKTYGQLLTELEALIDDTKMNVRSLLKIDFASGSGIFPIINVASGNYGFARSSSTTSAMYVETIKINSQTYVAFSINSSGTASVTNETSNAPTSGTKITLMY